jgi:hypothetical protein
MTRFVVPVLAAAAAAVAFAASAPQALAAPCQTVTAFNGSALAYVRCQIPDLDQRREEVQPFTPGLPNDGKMYCAPTAALDLMTYLANQGFPSVMPGPGSWGPEPWFPPYANYNTITANLSAMGALMQTSPTGGTGGDGVWNGLAGWLATAGVGSSFTVSSWAASGPYSPTFSTMGQQAVSGALVMPVVGWYTPWSEAPQAVKDAITFLGISLPAGYYRNGGHVLALAVAKISGANQLIGFRDPASPNDGVLDTQSNFTTDNYGVVDELNYFDGEHRVQSRTVGLGKHGYLDGFFTVKPKWSVVTDKGTLIILKPIHLNGDDSAPTETISRFPAPGRVLDIALSPERTSHPYLVEGDNTIWQLDELTGRSTRFATVGNPRRLVFGGRDQKLYVLLPRHVISLDTEGREQDRTLLREPLADIAWDASAARLVGLAADGSRLLYFDGNLKPAGSLTVPTQPCASRSLVVAPGGDAWILCGESGRALHVSTGERGPGFDEVALTDGSPVGGLSVDDQGHLFASVGGRLVEFDGLGRRLERSSFSGLPGGDNVEIARSFSNFDPRTMSDIRYRNVLPEDSLR